MASSNEIQEVNNVLGFLSRELADLDGKEQAGPLTADELTVRQYLKEKREDWANRAIKIVSAYDKQQQNKKENEKSDKVPKKRARNED